MTPKPRYVFDKNAIISALLFEHSVSGQAFYAALDQGEILGSQETFTELSEVLGREQFDRYVIHEEREQFLVRFLREAALIEITEEIRACRDSKDDKFLESAVSGGASCIITEDQDLLVLHPFRGMPILTPAQYLKSLARERDGRQGSE